MPDLLKTTPTVASETLADHRLTRRQGGQLFVPAFWCSCGGNGDEAWGPLHLVEMGVEAGVAAMAELCERQEVSARAELTPLERAERELAAYMRDDETDTASWRFPIAVLVRYAADVDSYHPSALRFGARLWLELERLEGMDAMRDDGAEPGPGPDRSLSLPHQTCDRGMRHWGHAWRPITSGAPREAWCPGA